MLSFLFFVWIVRMGAIVKSDPAGDQVINFKKEHPEPTGIVTSESGAPVSRKSINTLNTNLLLNAHFMDTLTHTVRERIPPRVVHAKAAGAFGYFKVTHDVSDVFVSKLFHKVGETTPVAIRLSTSIQNRGGVDTGREIRGFAIKFYTEEGNFDIIGFNTPMFLFKDPILFTSFVHSVGRNPVTNLKDPNTFWDYLTLRPENLHIQFLIYSDRGIPDGYRHMPGFSIHTYEVVNEKGEVHFVRFHFLPDAGIKNLRSEEARKIASEDPDYATRDLYNDIATGNFPRWTLYIQALTLHDVKTAGFDVFDITKVLSLKRFPLREVGFVELNRNPLNYFAEVEQMAYCPSNRVPGIKGAPDKAFEARVMAYKDAQRYRLGANFMKIPVNCPYRVKVYTYNRDGSPPVNDNEEDIINYYPNSFSGPKSSEKYDTADMIKIRQDPKANNYDQARDVYLSEMTPDERSRFVENLLRELTRVAKFIQDRAVKIFTEIHPELGRRIKEGLQSNRTTAA